METALERDRCISVAVRVSAILACLAYCLLPAGPSRAQSLTDGPLAAPATVPAPKGSKGKTSTRAKAPGKGRTARKPSTANATAADLDDGREPTATPASKPVPRRSAAQPVSDPLSLGMKWTGSNDNAEQTRIQNYGGAAAGTGASVGLNYHF